MHVAQCETGSRHPVGEALVNGFRGTGRMPSVGHIREKWDDLPGNLRGACWVAAAGLVLTLMTAMIKSVGATIPVLQILFIRQVVMTLAMAPRFMRDPSGVFGTRAPGLHGLRIVLSAIAMSTGFTAMVHLPLADAVAISFSRSFFVAIFAIVLLHEVVTRHRWFGIAAGFAGVVIITAPTGEQFNIYAFLGVASAGAVAMIMVIIRKMAQREALVTVITYQALGVGALLAIPAAMLWQTPTPGQWVILLLIGVASTLGQSLNFMGFRAGEATALAPVDYLRLIYSLLIGAIFFLETPTPSVLAGAGLVILGALWGLWHDRGATMN